MFLKGQLDKYLNNTITKESFLSKALYIFKIGTYLSWIKCPGFVWEATPVKEMIVKYIYFFMMKYDYSECFSLKKNLKRSTVNSLPLE